MKETFSQEPKQERETSETKEMSGIPYDLIEGGLYIFQDVNIGGTVKSGDDFRDFIVNTENVGVRTDADLVLPDGTSFEDGGEDEVLFTLPKTKQRGRIFSKDGVRYAVPID